MFSSGNSIFRLDDDKVLHLTEVLDRDQGDLSSVVFQVISCNKKRNNFRDPKGSELSK